MFSAALGYAGAYVPNYFIKNAKDLLKDRQFVANAYEMYNFVWHYSKNTSLRLVTSLDVAVPMRTLVAHKLQLPTTEKNDSALIKKAIIYMMGNCFYVAESLPKVEQLLKNLVKDTNNLTSNVEYTVFCQDYRGRGFNQENKEENFNDYPMSQDAEDQAALIRKLVEEEGYKPEDIFVLGYSFGSAVGLWAIYNLVKDVDVTYANIKFYSDRGFGNLFDYPIVRPFVHDQEEAHQRLHALGMMPNIFLHEIARQLEECLVTAVAKEHLLHEKIALVERLTQTDMPGRVWVAETDNPSRVDPHLASHQAIHAAHIPELKSHYFMLAIMHEMKITLLFNAELPKDDKGETILGYALKKDALPSHTDFVAIPPLTISSEEKPNHASLPPLTVTVTADLISRLHAYCLQTASQAIESGLGAANNKAWLSTTGWTGWTAKQQIQMAIRLMTELAKNEEVDVLALLALQQEVGPHASGRLCLIFQDIIKFAEDYKRLQQFNAWIASMEKRREDRAHKKAYSAIDLTGVFSPDASVGEWERLNPSSDEESNPSLDEEWEELELEPSPTMSVRPFKLC